MSVYVTGDIHGCPTRFSTDIFFEQKEFSGNKDENVVIICGDFGLVWNRNKESKEEKYWLDWLQDKPFTTVFVDGNHDNFERIDTYPVKEWHGGKVHEIRENVLHLMRGEVFTIENKKFFAFGGASSHDISDGIIDYKDPDLRVKEHELEMNGKFMYRIKGLTWWEEELPTIEEMEHGIEKLKENNNEVDFIITHSPSTSELKVMNTFYDADVLTDYLEKIKDNVKYEEHIFGHMHIDRNINEKDSCLYEQIVRIV